MAIRPQVNLMKTAKQSLGHFGETLVTKKVSCPKCKVGKTLKALPNNFKCADLICDFCGYLAQVKCVSASNLENLPATVLGAAWAPQKARMNAGIYFPLFLVLRTPSGAAIYYLAADLQSPSLFKPRNPLSTTARKSGWQGFRYILKEAHGAFVRLA